MFRGPFLVASAAAPDPDPASPPDKPAQLVLILNVGHVIDPEPMTIGLLLPFAAIPAAHREATKGRGVGTGSEPSAQRADAWRGVADVRPPEKMLTAGFAQRAAL